MSWVDKSDMFSRTPSRTSTASTRSTDNSPKNEFTDLNFTLYGAPAPLRRTRTIIHRAKGRTLRTLSLVPGLGGGAAKLLAENTTLDLGFTQRPEEPLDLVNPYLPIGETSSSARSSTYFTNRRESDSSSCDVVESEHSDDNISRTADCSSMESSPEYTPVDSTAAVFSESHNAAALVNYISRSSTCTSWTTDEQSTRSVCGSTSRRMEEYDNEMSGEWNNFWKNYNDPHGFELQTKVVNDQKIDDDKRSNSSCSTGGRLGSHRKRIPEKKSPQIQKVIMSTADAIEAASCARRLSEILSMAIRRSSLPCTSKNVTDRELLSLQQSTDTSEIPHPPPLPETGTVLPRSKSDPQLISVNLSALDLQNQKLLLKPLNNDCVEVEIRSTDPIDVAQILKKVLSQRRDVIMPSDDPSGAHSHRSDWSSFD